MILPDFTKKEILDLEIMEFVSFSYGLDGVNFLKRLISFLGRMGVKSPPIVADIIVRRCMSLSPLELAMTIREHVVRKKRKNSYCKYCGKEFLSGMSIYGVFDKRERRILMYLRKLSQDKSYGEWLPASILKVRGDEARLKFLLDSGMITYSSKKSRIKLTRKGRRYDI